MYKAARGMRRKKHMRAALELLTQSPLVLNETAAATPATTSVETNKKTITKCNNKSHEYKKDVKASFRLKEPHIRTTQIKL